MKEKLLNVFNKMKENSIGTTKKAKSTRKRISVTLKKSVATMLTILTAATFVGCNSKNKNKDYTKETYSINSMTLDDQFNGFTYDEIVSYEKNRVDELMTSYDLTDYTIINGKREYNYTVDDYKNMYALNDSYLRGFTYLTTDKTVNDITNVLGYENLADYMEKKGYKSDDEWLYDDLNNISYMMSLRYSKTK